MYDLSNRIVFITGASAGIGAACAEAFARQGARLLLCARRPDRLAGTADHLRRAHGADVHAFTLDVTEAAAVQEAIAALPEAWRGVAVLVNNAGLSRGLGPLHTYDVDHVDAMVDTNIKGLIYVTRAVVPGMVARGEGHVIHLGSLAGQEVYPGGAVYCATKHAVRALNRGLKMDLHGTGVRVSSVDPGLVETEFSLVRFDGDRERADAVYDGMTPLTAEDVAEAVLFCATRPPHVNISELMMLPVDQSSSVHVHRKA